MIKSSCFDDPTVPVQPKVSLDEVKKNAMLDLNVDAKDIQNGDLIIYPNKERGQLYLCWLIKIEDGINKGVMIDAQTGEILFK